MGRSRSTRLPACSAPTRQTAQAAVEAAVPTLLAGMHNNAQAPDGAASLESALGQHQDGLVDGGVDVSQVDTADGEKIVSHVFGGQQDQVASQLAGTAQLGGVGGDLVKKLLPILAPIVMSYLANKVLGGRGGRSGADAGGGGGAGGLDLGGILGGLLGGAAGGRRRWRVAASVTCWAACSAGVAGAEASSRRTRWRRTPGRKPDSSPGPIPPGPASRRRSRARVSSSTSTCPDSQQERAGERRRRRSRRAPGRPLREEVGRPGPSSLRRTAQAAAWASQISV